MVSACTVSSGKRLYERGIAETVYHLTPDSSQKRGNPTVTVCFWLVIVSHFVSCGCLLCAVQLRGLTLIAHVRAVVIVGCPVLWYFPRCFPGVFSRWGAWAASVLWGLKGLASTFQWSVPVSYSSP